MKVNDLTLDSFEEYFSEISDMIFNYRNNLYHDPVIPSIEYSNLKTLLMEDIPYNEMEIKNILLDIKDKIIPNSTKVGHPLFLAWMNNSGCDAGTLGDILTTGLNQVPFMYKAGPALTVIEDLVVNWFCKLIGFNDNSGGALVSGGTTANLTSLLAAREIKGGSVMRKGLQDSGKLVLYMSEQGHTSIERAVGVLGIGADNIRKVSVDNNFKININDLEQNISNDIKKGFSPFCVVAQGGSASVGSVDPLDKISDICKKYNLWMHVDAAYGGAAILSDSKKDLFKGIDQADSVTIDPHKWFFIPPEAGLVLIKSRENLYNTFTKTSCRAYKGNYEEKNYLDYGVQTARTSRALKIWFAFKIYGLNKIKACIENNIVLADELKKLILKTQSWEILNPVDLSIICIRYLPENFTENDKINECQKLILVELEKSGKAFLSPVMIGDLTGIRICFANHRTTLEDVDILFSLLTSIAKKVEDYL